VTATFGEPTPAPDAASTNPPQPDSDAPADPEVIIEAAQNKPSGLKQVLDVIPAHCYERSAWRGLSLIGRDVAVYVVAIVGLVVTNNPMALVPLWLLCGLAVSGLFVLGHDAAHDALFDSGRANAITARLTMLPSLHATEIWVFGHNRVHHGHTLKQGMDFVWHPLTVDQYVSLGRAGRLLHRIEWGPLGAGLYYGRNVWWNKMIRFTPPPRWARVMRRDQLLVGLFALTTLVVAVTVQGGLGVWTWFKAVVIPFALFCQVIGWVVHVHHIHPDIRWWPRREWNRYRGQVEGTTVFRGPRGWELFFHWIMVHLPHHVDMRIPCYRLEEAAQAIEEHFPDDVEEKRLSLSNYLASVRACKLHDFQAGTWLPYPSSVR
jgi:omega-6 fatty acid desaturase (delta-12 desaturase)